MVFKNDGTVVAWGDNELCQNNVPDGLTDVVSMAAGGDYSIGGRNIDKFEHIPSGLKCRNQSTKIKKITIHK